jgi:HEAT repeat protein
MFGFAGVLMFVLLGSAAQAQGNLSDVVAMYRAEGPLLSPASQVRLSQIVELYWNGKSLTGDWTAIDAGLSDPTPAVRDRICTTLSLILYGNRAGSITLPDKTRALLVERLSESSANTRENAARALALMSGGASPTIAPKLIELARMDPEFKVQQIATAALATVQPVTPAINEFWIESLSDVSNLEMRGSVLNSFRSRGPTDSRVISLVIEALKDNDRFVRQEAIATIVAIGKPAMAAVPLLTEIKEAPGTDESMRQNVESALRILSAP